MTLLQQYSRIRLEDTPSNQKWASTYRTSKIHASSKEILEYCTCTVHSSSHHHHDDHCYWQTTYTEGNLFVNIAPISLSVDGAVYEIKPSVNLIAGNGLLLRISHQWRITTPVSFELGLGGVPVNMYAYPEGIIGVRYLGNFFEPNPEIPMEEFGLLRKDVDTFFRPKHQADIGKVELLKDNYHRNAAIHHTILNTFGKAETELEDSEKRMKQG